MRESRLSTTLGVVAVAGYGVHAAYHVWRGQPENLLWACHLAALIVGAGLIAENVTLAMGGTLVLCMGTPLWIVDLLRGSEFMPTSLGTHVLGLAIGLWSVWHFGITARRWWTAALMLIALIAISRIATPPPANVNLAFVTPPGMERYFANHSLYLAVMIGVSCAYFWFIEFLFHRFLVRPTPKEIES